MVRFASFLRFSPLKKLLEDAKRAEKEGFNTACYGDHLLYPPFENQVFETWLVLNTIALNTQKIRITPCVTDYYRRHPAQMAQTIATLDLISNGRAFVMLGAGEAMNLEPFGISYKPRIQKLKETIEIMRLLWTSTSKSTVDYDGKFLKLHGAYLQVKPIQSPYPPIYLSALSPKSMRLAAQLADGWLTHVETPETYLKSIATVKTYAEEAGRNFKDLDTALFLPISISKKSDIAEKNMRFAKGIVLWRHDKLEEAGYNISIPEELKMTKFLLTQKGSRQLQNCITKIPDECAGLFTAFGNPDECIDKIEQFVKNGVKLVVLVNLNPDSEEFYNLMGAEVLPYFKT